MRMTLLRQMNIYDTLHWQNLSGYCLKDIEAFMFIVDKVASEQVGTQMTSWGESSLN